MGRFLLKKQKGTRGGRAPSRITESDADFKSKSACQRIFHHAAAAENQLDFSVGKTMQADAL
ncbi:hypothetical protein NZA98_31785, partial [Escherichia coli]|nr:hypothetical protein [Escherichia coli]